MQPLVDDMVQDDPGKRPNIDEVVARFQRIHDSLSRWRLRSRMIYRDEIGVHRVYRGIKHAFEAVSHIATLRPAIPTA